MTTGAGAAVPVPVSGTVCELGVALSEKLSVAFSIVVVDGLKVSTTAQLPPAVTGDVLEHVADTIVKSAAFGPEIDGLLLKRREPVPVFMSVTVTWPLTPP